jgi:uncharacterized protein (DUF2062 family)
MYLRKLRKKSFKEIKDDVLGSNDPVLKVAFSAALGVAVGVSPFWGYQIAIGILVAHFLKLNKAIVVVASHISLPPLIPFIIYWSYLLGGIFFKAPVELTMDEITLESVSANIIQYAAGSFFLSAVLALIAFSATYILITIKRKK